MDAPINDDSKKPYFRASEVYKVPKVWGEEHWIVNKEYCGKKLVLKKNMRCSIHQHKEKDEVFYVLKGKVLLELAKETFTLLPGDFVHVKRNTPHRFTGLEASEIMEFSTTHKEEDSYRIKESGHVDEDRFEREKKVLNSFPKASVLVVGDVMLDSYIIGAVDRVSPEAPIPVVQFRSEYQVPGGAANAARNVAALGGKATVIGVIGDDAYGKTLQSILKKEGVNAILLKDSSRHTIRKERILGGSHQLLRLDYESTHTLSTALEKSVLQEIAKGLKTCDVLLLSDYAKGLLSPSLIKKCIAMAAKAKVPVIVDPKPRDTSYMQCLKGATLITPNKKEAAVLTGKDDLTPEKMCAALSKELGGSVLVTLGEHGMLLMEKGKKAQVFPALTQEVADVSGAGDTVAATLALALASDTSLTDAADLANRAASIVVRKAGTATATAEELASTL
ncbi:D-glycero-beta-D-manno-heptose-7-phosphate kinase [Candidatus Peribacteria bacterium]|nr:MAG: D-glycero-beta-D-manno-heptose-7-phosphate kinase [Candidatus Peribacteria bacterium]